MDQKVETVSFRLEAGLKAEFIGLAQAEAKPVGELLRELVRDHIARKHRHAFQAEARRQSLEAADAARHTDSDEAKVMRELEANFEDFAAEWR